MNKPTMIKRSLFLGLVLLLALAGRAQQLKLLIIGQRDRTAIGKNLATKETAATMGNYPKLGKQTADKIKNSQLVELENVGHLPHIEAFSRFIIPLLEFLNK